MQVAFWSNYHGQTGNTLNTIATAVILSSNYNLKSLITHTQYKESSMENAFLSNNNRQFEIGIDAIERAVKSRSLNEENFDSYTNSLIKNRLDFLVGSNKTKYELFEKVNKTIVDIFYYAQKLYDLIFVDINSGFNDISQKVLKQSDVIVVNLSQNEKIIREFFEHDLYKLKEIVNDDKKKIVINIGNYDEECKCSKKYIKKVYKCDYEIFCTPYVSEYKDANNNHKILDYFMVNKFSPQTEYMISEVNKLVSYLLDINNNDKEFIRHSIRKKTFLEKCFKKNLQVGEV